MSDRPGQLALTIFVLLIGAVVASFVWPAKQQVLESCRMEALKAFGHLRKRNEFGFLAFQSELEDRYLELCMGKAGFALDMDLSKPPLEAAQIRTVGSEDRDIWMSDPEHWKRTSYWPSLR
jgi:hypothetical protein